LFAIEAAFTGGLFFSGAGAAAQFKQIGLDPA
jgi:hypothetical protein